VGFGVVEPAAECGQGGGGELGAECLVAERPVDEGRHVPALSDCLGGVEGVSGQQESGLTFLHTIHHTEVRRHGQPALAPSPRSPCVLVPCQNPTCGPDLLLYARHSCLSASSTSSWSGCSAGLCSCLGMTARRMRRSSCSGTGSLSCADRSRAPGRTGLTVASSQAWRGFCPGTCGYAGS